MFHFHIEKKNFIEHIKKFFSQIRNYDLFLKDSSKSVNILNNLKAQLLASFQNYENYKAITKSEYLMDSLIDRLKVKYIEKKEKEGVKRIIDSIQLEDFKELIDELFKRSRITFVWIGNINEKEASTSSTDLKFQFTERNAYKA